LVTVRLTPSSETRFSHDAEAFAATRDNVPCDNSDPNRCSRTLGQHSHNRLFGSTHHSSNYRNAREHRGTCHRRSVPFLQPDLACNWCRFSPRKRLGVDPRNDLHSPLYTRRSLRRLYRSLPSRLCPSFLDHHDRLSHQISCQSLLRQRNHFNLHARDEHATDNENCANAPITDPVRSNSAVYSPIHPLHSRTSANTRSRRNWEVSFLRRPSGSRQLVLH